MKEDMREAVEEGKRRHAHEIELAAAAVVIAFKQMVSMNGTRFAEETRRGLAERIIELDEILQTRAEPIGRTPEIHDVANALYGTPKPPE